MAKIRITSRPPGQAPEWVRDAWIGLELPVLESAEPLLSMGALGGEAENAGGYDVDTKVAMEILTEAAPDAAQWWADNVPWLVFSRGLEFSRDACELVE